jgi:ribosomal protein L6P/L9E
LTGFTRVGHSGWVTRQKRGNNLVLAVGKSHTVEFAPPSKDVTFEVEKDVVVHRQRHQQGQAVVGGDIWATRSL